MPILEDFENNSNDHIHRLNHALQSGMFVQIRLMLNELPPADVVEKHRTDHIPYRSWCKWCVEGRGRGAQHSASPGSSVPIVGADYFFMTSGGVKKREELEYELDAAGEEQL